MKGKYSLFFSRGFCHPRDDFIGGDVLRRGEGSANLPGNVKCSRVGGEKDSIDVLAQWRRAIGWVLLDHDARKMLP
eukprot:scaffold54604_cov73-Cyclotella_meneghiniana.AAC.4